MLCPAQYKQGITFFWCHEGEELYKVLHCCLPCDSTHCSAVGTSQSTSLNQDSTLLCVSLTTRTARHGVSRSTRTARHGVSRSTRTARYCVSRSPPEQHVIVCLSQPEQHVMVCLAQPERHVMVSRSTRTARHVPRSPSTESKYL